MRTKITKKIARLVVAVIASVVIGMTMAIAAQDGLDSTNDVNGLSRRGGIREEIPAKFAKRYGKWRSEFLSTEIGREQWESYRHDPKFILTITIDNQKGNGAGTASYEWDEHGQLIGATVTLGPRLNEGFPGPAYYPVTSSLQQIQRLSEFNGNILAATKIAHELGHVGRTRSLDGSIYRLQSDLMEAFNKILLRDGYNGGRARLLELAREMGGTPVEICEENDYWAKVNAMRFLHERITDQRTRLILLKEIAFNIKDYAAFFTERFHWPEDVIVSRLAKK